MKLLKPFIFILIFILAACSKSQEEKVAFETLEYHSPENAENLITEVRHPKEVLSIREHDAFIGDAKAQVTIIVYSSLGCPHCGEFHHNVIPKLKTNYIDKGVVNYVQRDFPFDKLSYYGAIMARCGGKDYYKLIDILFEAQDKWAYKEKGLDVLKEIAAKNNIHNFEECLKDTEIKNAILKNVHEANKVLNLSAAPSIFINGELYKGSFSYKAIAKHIDALLEKK